MSESNAISDMVREELKKQLMDPISRTAKITGYTSVTSAAIAVVVFFFFARSIVEETVKTYVN